MSAFSVIMDFDVSGGKAPPPPSSGVRTQAWSEDSAPKLAAPKKEPTPPKLAPPMPGCIAVRYASDGGGPSDQPQVFFFESEPTIPVQSMLSSPIEGRSPYSPGWKAKRYCMISLKQIFISFHASGKQDFFSGKIPIFRLQSKIQPIFIKLILTMGDLGKPLIL